MNIVDKILDFALKEQKFRKSFKNINTKPNA